MINSLPLLLAQDQQPNPFGMLIPMILIFVMMYFLMIRPQRKRQMELQAKLNALKSGDSVITAGGIHGLITNVSERTVMVKIADNVKIRVEKTGIADVLPKESAEPSEPEKPAEN